MRSSQKKPNDAVQVSIRPEEIDSILGLRNTFDHFEVFGNYVSSYLELGWDIKLVIPHLDITLDVDFQQGREVWNQALTDLAMKGIHTCPVVYTGPASNLMVLEVHGKNAEKALVLGRDWRAQCIVQLENDREQHFFTWPQFITLPDKAALETLDIQVFGEGGKVILPPSPAPTVEDLVRWVVPPWESPPSPPTPRLLDFLKGHFSVAESECCQAESDILPWKEIFAHIASHARLMQTLLTPVIESEDYYRSLLREARASGLQDQRLLLGLLWHAPLGESRHELKNLEWFKDLIKENDPDSIPDSRQMQIQLTDLIKELSKTLTELRERENHPKENYQELSSGRSQPDDLSGQNKSRPISPRRLASEQAPFLSPSADTITEPAEYCINDAILHQEKIPDQLKENEARIDKLERLEAGEKNTRRNVLEGDSLKVKIEAQRQGEIEHLSQLKNGKWW